jgi:uroporphyrinogen-III decarboxylase
LRRTRLAGIAYLVEGADYQHLSESEYQAFALPADQRLIESLSERWWLNMVSVRGQSPMLRLFTGLPVQLLHWEDTFGRPELEKGQMQFRGAVAGGLSAHDHLVRGTPTTIREAVRQAVRRTEGRRFLLTTGRPLSAVTPLSHLQAVRDSAQQGV